MLEAIIAIGIGVFSAAIAAALFIYFIIYAVGHNPRHVFFGTSRAKALTEKENSND